MIKDNKKYKKSYIGKVYDLIKESKIQKPIPVVEPQPLTFDSILETKTDDDIWDIPEYNNSYRNKKFPFIKTNERHKIFCKCGHTFEFHLVNKTVAIPGAFDGKRSIEIDKKSFIPVVCEKCKEEYRDYTNLFRISGEPNFFKLLCLENEKSITLYSFSYYPRLNPHTKKIIIKEVKTFISFNKEKKCFYVKNWKYFQRIGLTHLHNQISNFKNSLLSYGTLNSIYEDCKNDYEKLISSKFELFFSKLENFINKNDVIKINEIFKLKHEELVRELHTNIQKNNGYISGVIAKKDVTETNYKSIEERIFFLKLITYVSVINYPSLSTILFTKGLNFYLDLIEIGIYPRVSTLKINNPTSSHKIIEESIKQKLKLNSKLYYRLWRINDKITELKEKNTDPEVEKLQTSGYKVPMYDTRIPSTLLVEEIEKFKLSKQLYAEIDAKHLNVIINFFGATASSDVLKYDFLIKKYGIEPFYHTVSQLSFDNKEEFISFNKKFIHLLKLVKKDFKTSSNKIISGNLGSYKDTFRLLKLVDGDENMVYKMKSLDEVGEFHDKLSGQIKLMRLERYDVDIKEKMNKYSHFNKTIDGVKFLVLDSSKELVSESTIMNHCVSSYTNSVAEGNFIILRIIDKDENRATLSIYLRPHPTDKILILEFNQLKAKFNQRATENIINVVVKFLKDVGCIINEYSFSQGADLCPLEPKTMEDILKEKNLENNIEINF